MTTYTVFTDEFEEHACHSGLTLEQAFALVLDQCNFDHAFERRADGYVLTVSDRKYPELDHREIVSTIADELGARRDLMLQAMDGRFKAQMALPDAEFQVRLREALAFLDGETERARRA